MNRGAGGTRPHFLLCGVVVGAALVSGVAAARDWPAGAIAVPTARAGRRLLALDQQGVTILVGVLVGAFGALLVTLVLIALFASRRRTPAGRPPAARPPCFPAASAPPPSMRARLLASPFTDYPLPSLPPHAGPALFVLSPSGPVLEAAGDSSYRPSYAAAYAGAGGYGPPAGTHASRGLESMNHGLESTDHGLESRGLESGVRRTLRGTNAGWSRAGDAATRAEVATSAAAAAAAASASARRASQIRLSNAAAANALARAEGLIQQRSSVATLAPFPHHGRPGAPHNAFPALARPKPWPMPGQAHPLVRPSYNDPAPYPAPYNPPSYDQPAYDAPQFEAPTLAPHRPSQLSPPRPRPGTALPYAAPSPRPLPLPPTGETGRHLVWDPSLASRRGSAAAIAADSADAPAAAAVAHRLSLGGTDPHSGQHSARHSARQSAAMTPGAVPVDAASPRSRALEDWQSKYPSPPQGGTRPWTGVPAPNPSWWGWLRGEGGGGMQSTVARVATAAAGLLALALARRALFSTPPPPPPPPPPPRRRRPPPRPVSAPPERPLSTAHVAKTATSVPGGGAPASAVRRVYETTPVVAVPGGGDNGTLRSRRETNRAGSHAPGLVPKPAGIAAKPLVPPPPTAGAPPAAPTDQWVIPARRPPSPPSPPHKRPPSDPPALRPPVGGETKVTDSAATAAAGDSSRYEEEQSTNVLLFPSGPFGPGPYLSSRVRRYF